jgi:hypothetical protein
LCHNIRGLLSEYGIVLNRGVSAIRKGIPRLLEDAENGLSERFRSWLHQGYQRLGRRSLPPPSKEALTHAAAGIEGNGGTSSPWRPAAITCAR